MAVLTGHITGLARSFVCLSICYVWSQLTKLKGAEETKIGVNVSQGRSNRLANFYYKEVCKDDRTICRHWAVIFVYTVGKKWHHFCMSHNFTKC